MVIILAEKYELREQIGVGGSGVVYLAWDRHLERLVAIKSQRFPQKEEDAGMLRQEMEMLKTLKHPMLPEVYDYFEEDARYLVMEYIQGENLHQYIEREGAAPEEQVWEWALQLTDLFSYLHTQKPPVIYRDLKAQNIIVCPDKKLRVVDFGTAFLFHYEKRRVGNMAGTIGYAAPEQLGGKGQIACRADERSDIYTFGAVLYHMLTGFDPARPPYGIRPVREMNPALTTGMEWIVGKCTKEEPSKRYQSMEDVRADLERKSYLCRKRFCLGLGGRRRHVLRKLEKRVWLTDKKTLGLMALVILLAGILLGRLHMPASNEDMPLPVIVYNNQGQKLVIRYDHVYTPEGNLIFELGQELFAKAGVQELTVSLTDCVTGKRQERIFYLAGRLTQ